MTRVLSIGVMLTLLFSTASAQWLHIPLPATPRTPDGKPNLTAPLPRTPGGKPDLSGIWAAVTNRTEVAAVSVSLPRTTYTANIAADLPDGAPLTPWAKAIHVDRRKTEMRDSPGAKCLPEGLPTDMLRPTMPFKIIQTPDVTIILLEQFNNWRQLFTDGRELPVDPQPASFGYSIARWEGDLLVVSSAGFRDEGWLDAGGTPHSDMLRLTERYRRIDFGHMEVEYTFDDPKAFTKPWSAVIKFQLQPDTELLDHQCENEKFTSGAK
jgi:hypothetical protein